MEPAFRSFWQAGFESACHVNRQGVRLDMIAATQHDLHREDDYRRVASLGMQVVREGVRWPCAESCGAFQLAEVVESLAAARRQGIQVLWTLLHYGTPDDLDLFSPRLAARFARYCRAVASVVRQEDDAIPWYTPINEISFLAWAAGEVGYMAPCGRNRGGELKRNLVAAAIAGMEAIREVDPRARFLHCDPLIYVVAPLGRPDLARRAADQTAAQFEAWDMLAGGLHPELGGRPEWLDMIGLNYYHANQWEVGGTKLNWDEPPRDPRRVPLSRLLEDVYRRYRRPLLISETSHVGSGRARWIRHVARGVELARRRGVPVEGICVYPIIDRPDWDDPAHWHRAGVWDLAADGAGRLARNPCRSYLRTLRSLARAGG